MAAQRLLSAPQLRPSPTAQPSCYADVINRRAQARESLELDASAITAEAPTRSASAAPFNVNVVAVLVRAQLADRYSRSYSSL